MNNLLKHAYLRLSQIVGNKKKSPAILPIIPIGKSTWWRGVKSGKYPKPVKLGTRTTVWRAEDIRALLEHGLSWADAQKRSTPEGE